MLLLTVGTFAGLDLLIRNQALATWLDRKDEASSRQTRKTLIHEGYWQSMDELWLYEELPRADFSNGGVFFLGASEVQTATRLWELPPGLRKLIHNYGISGSNPKGELLELRYLIDQCGILKGGPEKSLIILGADPHCAQYPSDTLPPDFADNWVRHGFYTCDAQNGIRPVPINPISKWMEIEEIREGKALTRWRQPLLRLLARQLHHGVEPERVHNPDFYAEVRRREMGPDWQKKIEGCVQSFGELLDYLASQRVEARVILMPNGAWFDSLPYGEEFRSQMNALCAKKRVPLYDWSKMLRADEFSDANHPNIYGMDKLQPAFLDIAVPFLRSTGAWK